MSNELGDKFVGSRTSYFCAEPYMICHGESRLGGKESAAISMVSGGYEIASSTSLPRNDGTREVFVDDGLFMNQQE